MLAHIRTVKHYKGFGEDFLTLTSCFNWPETIEGGAFWLNIDGRNFEPFYEKYPEPRKEKFFLAFQAGQYNGVKIPKDIRWIDQYLTKDGNVIPGACLLTYYAEMLDLGWKPVDKANR